MHTFHFTLFIGPINLNCGSLERRVRWRGKLSGVEYHISVDFVGNKFSYSYLLTVPIMEVMGSIWMNKIFLLSVSADFELNFIPQMYTVF